MHGCGWMVGGWGWGMGGMLAGIILLILAAAAIAVFMRASGRKSGDHDRRDSLDILKRRLASGDISIEEFEQLKRHL